jgi:hypothetical protein
MVLAYNVSRTTADLDGIFEPKALVYTIAADVSREIDGVREDWLNDAVKAFPFPHGSPIRTQSSCETTAGSPFGWHPRGTSS